MKKISIIVTSYNNSHNLEYCIKSLINQSYDKNIIDLEIIFVDSGSTDNSIDILNRYKGRIKTVFKPQKILCLSPAMARNIGAKNAGGGVLIFTDSDCIFPRSWVRNMVDCFKDSQIDCVTGNREPDFGNGLGAFMRRYDFILYSNKFTISEPLLINEKSLQRGEPFILLSGNNFAIKREVWNKLGGMKTVFKRPAGEDIMLEIDLIKNGYNILFNPQSKVIHFHPLSIIEIFKKVFPRSKAIYLLGKYSNGFVNWRHFAERGHILNIRSFSLSILSIILTFSILSLLKIPFSIILSVLFTAILLIIIHRTVRVSKRLESILNSKDEKYKKAYKISLFKLFYFNQIHFFMKVMASINFLMCVIKDKYAIVTKSFSRKG